MPQLKCDSRSPFSAGERNRNRQGDRQNNNQRREGDDEPQACGLNGG